MGSVVDKILGTEAQAPSAIKKGPFDVSTGLFGGAFDPTTGEVTSDLDPRLKRLQSEEISRASTFGRSIEGAGAGARGVSQGAFSALTDFDPFAAAEDQFSRLDAILEPGRTSARTGTAAGLLSTGRLGSTAGARTQASVEGELENQRQQLLGDQFGVATQIQQLLANIGTSTGAFGTQEQLAKQQLQQGSLGGALSIDAQLQAALGLGSQITAPVGVDPGNPSGFQTLLGGFAGGLGSGAGAAIFGG